MKPRLNALLLLLFPFLLHAQEKERHPEIIILPQELDIQYKSLRGNLSRTQDQVGKLKEVREEVKKLYRNALDAPDVIVMLHDLDNQEQQLEIQRKGWKEDLAKTEVKIREIVLNAHGRLVEWRAYNPNPVDKLGTVITTTYSLKDDQIMAVDAYYQLTDTDKH